MTDLMSEGCCGIGVTAAGDGPVEKGDPEFDHWECMEHPGERLIVARRRGHWVGLCATTHDEAIRFAVVAVNEC